MEAGRAWGEGKEVAGLAGARKFERARDSFFILENRRYDRQLHSPNGMERKDQLFVVSSTKQYHGQPSSKETKGGGSSCSR